MKRQQDLGDYQRIVTPDALSSFERRYISAVKRSLRADLVAGRRAESQRELENFISSPDWDDASLSPASDANVSYEVNLAELSVEERLQMLSDILVTPYVQAGGFGSLFLRPFKWLGSAVAVLLRQTFARELAMSASHFAKWVEETRKADPVRVLEASAIVLCEKDDRLLLEVHQKMRTLDLRPRTRAYSHPSHATTQP